MHEKLDLDEAPGGASNDLQSFRQPFTRTAAHLTAHRNVHP